MNKSVSVSRSTPNISNLIRHKSRLNENDLVIATKTDNDPLLSPTQASGPAALDSVGAALRKKRITFEALMESGRKIRRDLIKERYGLTNAPV